MALPGMAAAKDRNDGTTLTISVFGASDLTGMVTDQTRIRCRPPEEDVIK